MTDTIREQIISAIETKLGQATTAKGYNVDFANNVFRAQKDLNPDQDLPGLVVWPMREESSREYGVDNHIMLVKIEGFKEYGNTNLSVVAELIFGDIIEVMTGQKWTLSFTSGGTYEPKAGDTITGADSGATAYLESVSISSGSWAVGTAAGSFAIRRKSGTFESENLNIDGNANAATTDGTITNQNPVTTTTGGLADDIAYSAGGTEEYPEAGELVVASMAEFQIKYATIAGDPYQQP